MSTTIADLSSYGDVKGRDTYSRNSFFSVKGDGVSANALTQGFYGIPSAADTEYELARISVSEGAVDDEIGTLSVGVRDGTSLDNVLSLNQTSSELTSTTFTMNTTDVFATGTINVGTIQQNDLAEGSRLELVSDVTDPAINFVLGDLAGEPSTPLIVTEGVVAVTGSLTIDGTDILTAVTDGNPWTSTDGVTQLKTGYNNVEINVVNPYSTSVALDVNGSARFRGNQVFFYDEPLDTFYSTLAYAESTGEVRLQSSRAGDSVVLATSTGVDNTYLPRLTLGDGDGTQSATFSNVNVGIGAAPSGTYALEVVGTGSVSTGLVSGGDVDLTGNNLTNVTQLLSSDALAERSSIVLTSDDTSPRVEFVLGDLAGTPVTAATFTETLATVATPTTFSDNVVVTGDLTVEGTQVIFNTTTVEVEDINIEMGNQATTHTEIDGGGIILGNGVTGISTPSLLYSEPNTRWESSVGVNVPATESLTVGTTAEVSDGVVSLKTDSAFVYLGANRQWRMGIVNDADGDHFQISHDDLGTQATWEVKMDVLQ
jgi:hypothetical protein